MKKFTSLLIFSVIVSGYGFSQSTYYFISGKIVDAVSNQPLQGASVFAQNTTIGTATGADGNFKLYLPNGGYDLVVTFTGFQTETRRISTGDAGEKGLVITLKQKEKSMEDVVVKASNEVKDGWVKYGDFFLENFIGKTSNSKFCTIINKEVLKFYYSKKRNRLKVLASAPLQIENLALGYKIRYELDSFTHEYNTGAGIYSGYPLFEELIPADSSQSAAWAMKRQTAYNGSILHFMRSLYNRQLKDDGFEIQLLVKVNDKDSALSIKDPYAALNYNKDDSAKIVEVIPNQRDVALIYKNEQPAPGYLDANPDQPGKFQLTVLSFLPGESIVIEQNGYYYEQANFTINQYLGWEKMADMLPYDYKVM